MLMTRIVCGPPKYSELRINIAQAFQAVGTVVGPILASHVFFKDSSSDSLQSVQYVYLGIAIFVFVLAVVFYLSPIPEITDADMQEQLEATGTFAEGESGSIWKRYTLWWAVLSQGCYVGAQGISPLPPTLWPRR
jgi:MFS transporter, FHS family, L-fucose permease